MTIQYSVMPFVPEDGPYDYMMDVVDDYLYKQRMQQHIFLFNHRMGSFLSKSFLHLHNSNNFWEEAALVYGMLEKYSEISLPLVTEHACQAVRLGIGTDLGFYLDRILDEDIAQENVHLAGFFGRTMLPSSADPGLTFKSIAIMYKLLKVQGEFDRYKPLLCLDHSS